MKGFKIQIKGEHKAKRCSFLAGATQYMPKQEKDKTKYNRKQKHKGEY